MTETKTKSKRGTGKGPARSWTEAQNDSLRRMFWLHGRMWEGWPAFVGPRTTVSIKSQAKKLGCLNPGPISEHMAKQILKVFKYLERETGRDRHEIVHMMVAILEASDNLEATRALAPMEN